MRSRARRVAAAVALAVIALGLTGCTRASDVALRLNADGTLDFGVCESLAAVNHVDAVTWVHADFDNTVTDLAITPLPSSLAVGDVIHLSPAPDQRWDTVDVDFHERPGNSSPFVEGVFDRASLRVGEWTWAMGNLFERVDHCDLGGTSIPPGRRVRLRDG